MCLEQNISWLVKLHGIRSFHAPFHLFSQCFYIRVISTKASNERGEYNCIIYESWLCSLLSVLIHRFWNTNITFHGHVFRHQQKFIPRFQRLRSSHRLNNRMRKHARGKRKRYIGHQHYLSSSPSFSSPKKAQYIQRFQKHTKFAIMTFYANFVSNKSAVFLIICTR